MVSSGQPVSPPVDGLHFGVVDPVFNIAIQWTGVRFLVVVDMVGWVSRFFLGLSNKGETIVLISVESTRPLPGVAAMYSSSCLDCCSTNGSHTLGDQEICLDVIDVLQRSCLRRVT